MNKILFFLLTVLMVSTFKAQLGFTITNISGSNSITCTHDTVKLVAWSTYSTSVTFNWAGPSNYSGAYVKITLPGSYTVTATVDNLSVSQVTVIGLDVVQPSSTISPLTQSISCDPNSITTVSASTNLSLNLTHQFFSPIGGTIYSNPFIPSAPGTYTHCVIDNKNGCSTCKTFTVAGGQGIPTGSLLSPQNFTVACSSKSIAVVSFSNFVTSPVSGGPLSYTILYYNSQTIHPTLPLSITKNYTMNTSNTYTAIVRDNTTLCDLILPFTILQNYNAPNLSLVVERQILTCNTPTVRLLAYTSNPNTDFAWSFPALSGSISSNSITAFIKTAAPMASLITNYTITATNKNNLCKSATVIPIYQNIFPPFATIGTGGLDPCTNANVILTNISTTGIPANSIFTRTLAVNAISWSRYGALLQPTGTSTSSYQTSQQGVYTMTVVDLNNGCMSSTLTNMSLCVGLEENLLGENGMEVFPNPGNGKFYLLTKSKIEVGNLEMYNASGVLIRVQNIQSETTTIDIQNEANGLYFLIIKQRNQIIFSKKIIKE